MKYGIMMIALLCNLQTSAMAKNKKDHKTSTIGVRFSVLTGHLKTFGYYRDVDPIPFMRPKYIAVILINLRFLQMFIISIGK